ncbi:MAG TPA: helix-turn-helix domain-containing protein [Arthrobacter sp.]|jgi:DNA-binding transcriptional ArsR family regulator
MKPLFHPRVEDLDLSTVLHACADPTRLRLLADINAEPGKTCGTFQTDLSKSTLSAHFKVLRESGLIRQELGPGNSRHNWPRTAEVQSRFPDVLSAIIKSATPG